MHISCHLRWLIEVPVQKFTTVCYKLFWDLRCQSRQVSRSHSYHTGRPAGFAFGDVYALLRQQLAGRAPANVLPSCSTELKHAEANVRVWLTMSSGHPLRHVVIWNCVFVISIINVVLLRDSLTFWRSFAAQRQMTRNIN